MSLKEEKIKDFYRKLSGRERFNICLDIIHQTDSNKIKKIDEILASFNVPLNKKETDKGRLAIKRNQLEFFILMGATGIHDEAILQFLLALTGLENILLKVELKRITQEEAEGLCADFLKQIGESLERILEFEKEDATLSLLPDDLRIKILEIMESVMEVFSKTD